jgi:hypothetical protein
LSADTSEDDVVGGPPWWDRGIVVDGQDGIAEVPWLRKSARCCPPDVDGKQMSSVTCTFVRLNMRAGRLRASYRSVMSGGSAATDAGGWSEAKTSNTNNQFPRL